MPLIHAIASAFRALLSRLTRRPRPAWQSPAQAGGEEIVHITDRAGLTDLDR